MTIKLTDLGYISVVSNATGGAFDETDRKAFEQRYMDFIEAIVSISPEQDKYESESRTRILIELSKQMR